MTKLRNLSLCAALSLGSLPALFSATADPTGLLSHTQEGDAPGEADALEVTGAYLEGISGGDLDDLDKLFVTGKRSSVFENGSDEGDWVHYKEHHLAPEQESVENFRFTTKEEHIDRCGDGFLVRHVGGFTLDSNGTTRKFRAAVSFMLVPAEDGLRILHLHWSSRQAR